jgi:uncharacterized protein
MRGEQMTKLLPAVLLFCLGMVANSAADDWGPWEVPTTKLTQQETSTFSPIEKGSNGFLQRAVRFYQRDISPVDGPRCPMAPTCSTYALQALDRHGPLLGVFITVDRFYREIDPIEHSQPLVRHGYLRFADPLDENDFWLDAPSPQLNTE